MEPHEPDLKTIFCEALERPAGTDRLAYLERACGHDPLLRAQVDRLLGAHDRAGGFLGSSAGPAASSDCSQPDERATLAGTGAGAAGVSQPAETSNRASVDATDPPDAAPSPSVRPILEGPGSRIGPYKLLQVIGQGGMGAVFMAEQDKPVRRRVALKVIKAGMDSAQVVARFEAERQALALMDHPNIAKVFDAGTTDSGRPFFVMELVKGMPITQYCDEARLNPNQRLELIIPVCKAIQHAHQKGVIHRDVKPSNVLVTLIDARPVPKVIDFGVAKATDQRLTEKTLFTQFGSIVGTLEYMSPEQAELSGMDVDTRSDVYALGVLVYELLTGTTPLEHERLRDAGYAEILRRIKEEEPPKPSTRISGSGYRLASIAAVRGTEPARLTRAVRGDLDWIVMKALEKSRTRRYESPGDLARDIQRYLDGDAVEACPPSAGYRLRKFGRRHRGAIATAAALAGLLIAGAGISIAMAVRATRAELATREERNRAVAAEAVAKAEGEKSRRSAVESAAVLEFFQDQVLAAARPEGQEGGLGRDVTIRKAVDAAEPMVALAFKDQPAVEASIRGALGKTYLLLGEPGLAIRELDRAADLVEARLGHDHRDALAIRYHLANAYESAGRTAEAIKLLEATLKAFESKPMPDDRVTLVCRNSLANTYLSSGRTAEAITLYEANLKAQETTLESDDPETLTTRNNLATAYQAAGRTAEALKLHEATVKAREAKLGPDDPSTLISRGNLADAYVYAGRTAEAIKLFELTLKAMERKFGPDHPSTLTIRNHLAEVYRSGGLIAQAINLHESTVKAFESKLGPDHPSTLVSRRGLADAYRAAGQTDDAIRLLKTTLKVQESKVGPDHSHTLASRRSLADAYRSAGRTAEAIELLESTLKVQLSKFGPDHPDTLVSRDSLTTAYLAAGRTAQAISLLEATLKLRESKLGPDRPETRTTRHRLMRCYYSSGQFEKALPFYLQNYRYCIGTQGPRHIDTLLAMRDLGEVYSQLRRHGEAEPLFVDALAGLRDRPKNDPIVVLTETYLANMYQAQGRFDRAEQLFRSGLEQARKQFGPADPRTAGAMAQLGLNLLHQSTWLAAEPILRECLVIREKAQPDDWSTFNTRSMLGDSLMGQGKFAEAEPMIVCGYEGMKASEARIPGPAKPRLCEAAERVVRLYEAWGQKDKAAEWRVKLAHTSTPSRLPR